MTSSQDRDYGLEGKVSPELFNTQRIARFSPFPIPKRPSSRQIVEDFHFFFSKEITRIFSTPIFLSFFLTFARQRDSFFYPRSKRKSTFARKSRAHFRCAFNERSTRGIIKWLINKRMLIINSINWNPARYNSIE